MRRSIPLALTTAVLTGTVALGGPGVSSAGASAPAYTVQTLHFAVTVGFGTQHCDIVGDLYTPRGASATNRVPSILTTNGFGGSKDDQAPFAVTYAERGYAVLSYSGLGFGGSGCKITLDDPDYDGQAASQLVSFLGGAPGIAFTDAAHTNPVPGLNYIIHDAKDHNGHARRYDPRVGMWGGSYGGQIQFAAAADDARIDVINPQITWNDLSYSLDPNNTAQTSGVTTSTPGATKSTWAAAFSAEGIFDGVEYAQNDPSRDIGCPNFAEFVCPALVTAGSTGYLQPEDAAALRHASVSTYMSKIRIPTLLDQGEVDTLFNLNESIATYQALKAQGTPVAMMWRYNGHSGGKPSPTGAAYEANRIQAWFDHYLKGLSTDLGPAFAYYQDWTGTVGTADRFPIGHQATLYLSQSNLVAQAVAVAPGTQSFVTPAAGAPTTLGNLDVVGAVTPAPPLPDENAPGTFASWTGVPLQHAVTVVGQPTLDVALSAPVAAQAQGSGPGGQLVLFAKLYDVGTDGTPTLINGLVAPIRVPDVTKPVHVTLPAVAHQFAAGHRIAIYLAGGDPNYRGGLVAQPVTITTGSTSQALHLPIVGPGLGN